MEPSIFLDFHLPNAATWFYFSLLLTVALFFQFSRLLSIRNLDLLTLFLLVPGFLFLYESGALLEAVRHATEADAAALTARADRLRVLGYGWLLGGSLYWFVRAVFDLTLIRRPALSANLNTAGLSWMGIALCICLAVVGMRRTPDQLEQGQVGKRPAPIEQVQGGAQAVVEQAQATNGTHASPADVRFWAERSLALVCHAAVIAGLVMIGWRHFGDLTAGVSAATLYTLVPYTAYNIGQFHHVWPTAFLVWAVFFYRRPSVAGWLLGLAAGSAVFPALLFPLWFGFYSRRGASRFGLAFLLAATV
ncbi:MAG: hypothetical protein L0241_17170, partial [Planctomycetia bacterium]|nr:hypothetical protein [Planctomycetia bacterium]